MQIQSKIGLVHAISVRIISGLYHASLARIDGIAEPE